VSTSSIHCENCGAEIFGGQRFCRSCGRPTSQFSEENAPTQAMPPSAAVGTQRSPVDTGQPARPFTSPVYTPPGYYQPPPAHLPVPTYTPPQARSGWGWIVGIIGVVILSLLTMGIFVISRIARRPNRRVPPPPPVELARDGGSTLTESVTDGETTTTRSYPLSATARFALANTTGNITIEGWDQPRAQVITIKRGGSEQDRSNLKLTVSTDGGNLSLQTPTARGIQEVEYIVKLPKKLAEISLESTNSEIEVTGFNGKVSVKNQNGGVSLSKIRGNVSVATRNGSTELSDVGGDVSVSSTNGEVDLSDIGGAIDAHSVQGAISVVFESSVPSKPLKVESTNGSIDIKFTSIPDADLNVQTATGSIDIDGDLGLDSRLIGPRGGSGRLGKGGLPLLIKTVTGTITITK
jgi:hypothetical protein